MLLAAVAAFAGAFVQSATGMGFALVLSPALFAVMEPEEAVTAVLILGAVLCALVLFESRRVGNARARPAAAAGRARAGAWGSSCWPRSRRRRFGSAWGWWVVAGRRLAAPPRSRGGFPPERGPRGLPQWRAHHVDQRERAAPRSVARVGARAACPVPLHAGGGVPDSGRGRHRAARVQGGHGRGRPGVGGPAPGLRSRGLRARCGGLPAAGRRSGSPRSCSASSSARVSRASLPESSSSLRATCANPQVRA